MFEPLEASALRLRAITVDDVDLLIGLDSDPAVMRFINGGRPSTRTEVEDKVRGSLGHRWLAYDRAADEFIGWFGMRPSDDHSAQRYLGYRLRRAVWGKGLATEGSMALIAQTFSHTDTARILAQTMTVNTASRHVMERCGMRYLRTFFEDWDEPIEGSELGDVEYELTRADWVSRRTSSRQTLAVTADSAPFARGSVSLRIYPHLDLAAPRIVEELRAQAALAVEHGFDGVMTSEHHGGFAGYLPNPLQAAGFALDAMPTGWAAPCPLLLLLRPTALVIEETAWLAALTGAASGLGVAAGALPADFEIMDSTMDDLTARFSHTLARVAGVLGGGDAGTLAGDPAIAHLREHPVPVLSAVGSITAARRAAATGVGLMFDSLTTPTRCREIVDAYRAAGGSKPCVLIRRAWIGVPPREQAAEQLARYRSYAPQGAAEHWGAAEMAAAPDGAEVAARLVDAAEVAGADALNLRVHVPGVARDAVRSQIEQLGDLVAPVIRKAMRE